MRGGSESTAELYYYYGHTYHGYNYHGHAYYGYTGRQREHGRATAVPRGGPHRAIVQRRLQPVLPARGGRTQRRVARAREPQPTWLG